MGASHKTTNMSLPIFAPTDKPSWLGDWNPAMMELDNGVGGAIAKSDKASKDAANALGQITDAVTKAEQAQTTAENAKTAADAATAGLEGKLNATNGVLTGTLSSSALTGTNKGLIGSSADTVYLSSPDANTVLSGLTFGSHNITDLALKAESFLIKNTSFNGDINTIATPGIYYTIEGATNYPSGLTVYNLVIVYPTNDSPNFLISFLYNFDSGRTFVRNRNNGTWGTWTETNTGGGGGGRDYLPINNPAFTGYLFNNSLTSTVKNVIANVGASLILGNKSISDIAFQFSEKELSINDLALKNPIENIGQDLDVLITNGVYIGFNYKNAPTTKAYIVKVLNGGDALGGIKQIIFPLEDQGVISSRNKNASGWTSWKNIIGGGGGSAPVEDIAFSLNSGVTGTNNCSGYSLGKFHNFILNVSLSQNPSQGPIALGAITPTPTDTFYFPVIIRNTYGSGSFLPNTYGEILSSGLVSIYSSMNFPIGNLTIGANIIYT